MKDRGQARLSHSVNFLGNFLSQRTKGNWEKVNMRHSMSLSERVQNRVEV